jgi:hypothetical protein
MINKLQYIGKINYEGMIIDDLIPYNEVYYKMIKLEDGIYHQWFISQSIKYLENGHVFTERNYSGILNVLNELVPGWVNE